VPEGGTEEDSLKDLKKYVGKPITVDEMDFYPLDMNDFVEIETATGTDVTKEMMRNQNPGDMFSSKLIREVMYRSILHGDDKVTAQDAGRIHLAAPDLGRVLAYALNGVDTEADKGNPPSQPAPSGA
jgi:hypothetical protein